MAIRELDGLDPSHGGSRLPGDTSPTVGEFVGNLTGGGGRTRGISGGVGEEQAALDLTGNVRSEEHTSELQSRQYLVCRLLLEKKKKRIDYKSHTQHQC